MRNNLARRGLRWVGDSCVIAGLFIAGFWQWALVPVLIGLVVGLVGIVLGLLSRIDPGLPDERSPMGPSTHATPTGGRSSGSSGGSGGSGAEGHPANPWDEPSRERVAVASSGRDEDRGGWGGGSSGDSGGGGSSGDSGSSSSSSSD